MNQHITQEEAYNLLKQLKTSSWEWSYDRKKHKIIIPAPDEDISVRLPVTMPDIEHIRDIDDEEDNRVNYVILLIQSGSCAIGHFDNDLMLDHKVFKSYMVRKKQGKSQIKYLKSKGKSRAGSRVRLANTMEFFENINERLQEYFEDYEVDRIALSCSKTLLPYLFNSKVSCPFDKKDERLIKIPKHIHTPGYEILMETQEWLLKGEIKYNENHQSQLEYLLNLRN